LFTPTLEIQKRMEPAVRELREGEATPIGLHLRRGDTGRDIFYFTPNEWYLAWLEEHWDRFDRPRLFVATEDRYALYNYLPYDLRNPTAQSMDWFPDWYLLTQCDALVFGESTFSFSAAMMNTKVQECWQSRLSTSRGCLRRHLHSSTRGTAIL
jgi:hypothetical protein